ncbi:uncharacterized protein LOC9643126 [Selaginella moellendorffii]|uniref:uncharacterized protein LOC9643126 n=1 Tax=Selaginella moellendorffii TaxID=88036 RepID=UPI000D1C83CC|nr:uncharacterized protein LOC9643126 [Selaginella moellendorffii]|eukprot:XP_024533687.1 uncharacterized protein LOC9643126 [Selaginella moellendorffii]
MGSLAFRVALAPPLVGRSSRHGARISGARYRLSRCCFSSQSAMASAALEIELIPCLKDNYAYLLRDASSGAIGVVDPSTAQPVIEALERRGLKLTHIINTHHHWDHTGGNADLKKRYGAQIVAPPGDGIPGIDVPLKDGDTWMLGEHAMKVIGTPGHTRGHVSYYFADSRAVFTGDTLFSIGCGRLFEGSAQQMWSSLSKLAALPDETRVFCGHEYTLSNAKFAMTIEPNNPALNSHFEKVKQLRDSGLATIPSSVGEEKKFNPFLRPASREIRRSLNLSDDASDSDVFAAVRKAKDRA